MRLARKESRAALGLITLLLVCPAIFFAACSMTPVSPPTVNQVVLVWLKHPQRAADRTRLVHMAHSLRMIPGVLQVEAGRTVPPLGPRARQDFDLAVVITFRDRAALQRYEKDPHHIEAMRRYLKPLVRHYEVYNPGNR